MNQLNDKGQRHGQWEDYWSNGNLWSKGNYNNGERYGYWESYYQNGQLHWKGYFVNDKPHGYWEWHPITINEHNQIEKEFYL